MVIAGPERAVEGFEKRSQVSLAGEWPLTLGQ